MPYPGLLADGQTFTISDGLNTLTFEFDLGTSAATPGNVGIPFLPSESASDLRATVLLAISNNTGSQFKVSASLDATGTKVYLAGATNVDTSGTPALQYAAQIVDGDKFTVGDGIHTVIFEFDNNGSVASGDVAVPFTAVDSPLTVAVNMLLAFNSQYGTSFGVSASVQGWTGQGSNPGVTSNRIDLFGAQHVDLTKLATPSLTSIKFNYIGDQNPVRPQGEVILANNRITNAANAGILIEPATRGPQMQVASNLVVLNTQHLAPGIVIENNIVDSAGTVGIQYSGDLNPDASGNPLPNAIVPFGRIINNTIYGTAMDVVCG